MPSLFLLTVGPVQGFIAAARRSRDLEYGSWLLSELVKAAALALIDRDDQLEQLIFPAPVEPAQLNDEGYIVSNRLLAIVEGEPGEVAAQVQQAMKQRLRVLWQNARGEFKGQIADDMAWQQIDDLPEMVWAAAPLDADGNYAQARQQVERALAARKATHDFRKVPWDASSLERPVKSSIDGVRESVIPESNYPHRREGDDAYTQKARALFDSYGVGPAERLSGVDLLKRHGRGQRHFPSTSHLAALSLAERLPDAAHADWEKFVAQMRRVLPYYRDDRYTHSVVGQHAELLFEARIAEYVPKQEGREDLVRRLRDFLNKHAGGQQPLPYYALLQADGDNMGKTISNLAEQGPNAHRQLSRMLDAFAAQARTIVEQEHSGALVFAGGDDVLALLPLHTAIDCAAALKNAFSDALQQIGDLGVAVPTLSAGLVVFHHLEPLSDALTTLRATENYAKQHAGKHALAINVSKRSGGERRVRGTWDSIVPRLHELVKLHRNDDIAGGAAYELEQLARTLRGDDHKEARQAEALRILKRKRGGRGERDLKPETLEQLRGYLAAIDVHNLAQELVVTSIFADAARLAGKEPQ
jgi:CRISPR-associated protein Cmr2